MINLTNMNENHVESYENYVVGRYLHFSKSKIGKNISNFHSIENWSKINA